MEDKVFSSVTETETATVIQTCSVASEMTGNDASVRDFVEQEESSIMDSEKNESSKWTNEKHSLYLKSIEASFVDQLYNTLDMLSCQTQDTNCSDAILTWKNHSDACISSTGQYKVLRHGCWSKKSFKRQNSHLKDRPHVSPGNAWIQHFRNGSHKRLSSTATASSPQFQVPESQLDQEPGCSNNLYQHASVAEVMDQNFVEDTSCSKKRVRTSKIGHTSNDQVVPHCTSATTEIPGSCVSPKR